MTSNACCCGMTDEPNTKQYCLPRGMDMGGHCSYPEPWCNECPLAKEDPR